MSDLFTAVGNIMLFYSRDHRKRTKQKNNNRDREITVLRIKMYSLNFSP